MSLVWGNAALRWGASDVVWGTQVSLFNLDAATISNWAIEVEYSSGQNLYYWTGPVDLDFNEITYAAVPVNLLSIGAQRASQKPEGDTVSVRFLVIEPSQRIAFLQDPGVVKITLMLLYSQDGGNRWELVPRRVKGFLSSPVLEGGVYSFEIVQQAGDVDRGRPDYWSDSHQKQKYPGDEGFSYLSRLSDGVDIRWPPI